MKERERERDREMERKRERETDSELRAYHQSLYWQTQHGSYGRDKSCAANSETVNKKYCLLVKMVVMATFEGMQPTLRQVPPRVPSFSTHTV